MDIVECELKEFVSRTPSSARETRMKPHPAVSRTPATLVATRRHFALRLCSFASVVPRSCRFELSPRASDAP
jgi:hypothetical protein